MIRILYVKVFKPYIHTNRIYDYSKGLTELAEKFPGFLSSENFWNYNIDVDESDKMFAISKWKSLECWNKWKCSKERKDYHTQCLNDEYIGDILKQTKFYQLSDREVINNFKVY